MNHKKQAYEQLAATIHWNTVRGNTPETLNWDLEIAMLQEELQELVSATNNVDRLDALIDLKFVLNGTLGKLLTSPEKAIDAYELVLQANKQKSSSKDSQGKITKPFNFVGPEEALRELLKVDK